MANDPKSLFEASEPEAPARPSHAERVAPHRNDQAKPATETPAEEVVGSTDYKAYGLVPTGSMDCDVRHWRGLRMDMCEGVMFDYRLLTMVQ